MMSFITLNVYSRGITVWYERDPNERCLQFDAFIGKDYDSYKRELQTGGQLSDLTGRLLVYDKGDPDTEDDVAQHNKSIGHLNYSAESKEYDIEEGFHATVYLSHDVFNKIERWILSGKTKAVVLLSLTGTGIDEGPAPNISSEPVWLNEDHPSLPIESCSFEFKPDNYEIDCAPDYSETSETFGFLPHLEKGRSLSDWEYILPSEYRKEIRKQITEKFGDPEDFKNNYPRHIIYPRDLESRRTWITPDIAFSIGHRVATYLLEHPTPEASYKFKYRLKESLEELSTIIDFLHKCVDPSKVKNHDRLVDFEKEYNWNSWVWIHLNPSNALRDGKSSRDYWFVDPDAINPFCISYLNKPWMECPALECALTDALIHSNTLTLGEGLAFQKKLGWVGKLVRLGVSLFLGFIVYVTTSYNLGFGLFAGLITWIAFNIYELSSPRRKLLTDMDRLLYEMIDICNYFNSPHISPEFIKQRLLATASKGATWSTGAIALVEHAARRNPET